MNLLDDEPQRFGESLGATLWGGTLYELAPAEETRYHWQFGEEEFLIVIAGRPTLRTPEGERELAEGDAVPFPAGQEGAHQVVNRTAAPARYLVFARHVTPEVVEHLDSGKIIAMAHSESQTGKPLWSVHRLADAADYFDGEEPKS